VTTRRTEGVLLTGVYGSGKSSIAEEIAYLLEQRSEPHALLGLDYLSWTGTGTGCRADEFAVMPQNLAAVAANYRRSGIGLFVLAYFYPQPWRGGRDTGGAGLPLWVAPDSDGPGRPGARPGGPDADTAHGRRLPGSPREGG
jgi:energy-coupling factor transporter ATP-binding protein EcfA2